MYHTLFGVFNLVKNVHRVHFNFKGEQMVKKLGDVIFTRRGAVILGVICGVAIVFMIVKTIINYGE